MNRIALSYVRLAVVLCAVVVSGCGGGVDHTTSVPQAKDQAYVDDGPPLSGMLTGMWNASITMPDSVIDGFAHPMMMETAAVGHELRVIMRCADGTPLLISAYGDASYAEWGASTYCITADSACGERVLWLTRGTFHVDDTGTISGVVHGIASACGETREFDATLTGRLVPQS